MPKLGHPTTTEVFVKFALFAIILIGVACWITEGLTDWSWPIGTIGTAVIVLGSLGVIAIGARRHPLSLEEYEVGYIDRKVAQHRDGNIVG